MRLFVSPSTFFRVWGVWGEWVGSEGGGKREEGRGKGGGREGFWMDPGDLDICCSGKR